VCYALYLVSDFFLPAVEQDERYPKLTIKAVSEDSVYLKMIRQLIPEGKYAYTLYPLDFCGCYFHYESPAALEEELNEYIDSLKYDPNLSNWFNREYKSVDIFKEKQRLFWQEFYIAVNSFHRYLTEHIDGGRIMLYVTWEGDEGKPIVEQRTITPAFFSGESCNPLVENCLFTIGQDK
jgi:hypothetical protein